MKSTCASPEVERTSALGPDSPVAVIPPEEVRTFSGPPIRSAVTPPESDSTSAPATPVTVISPLELSRSTVAAAGTSSR